MGGKSHLHNIEGLIDHKIWNKFVMDHKGLFLCVSYHNYMERNTLKQTLVIHHKFISDTVISESLNI